jgi:hypothetical protein
LGVGTSGRGEDIRKGCRRVNMVEYYALVYANRKMRPVETFQEWGRMMEGVNSIMINCKNFCKCHNGPPNTAI